MKKTLAVLFTITMFAMMLVPNIGGANAGDYTIVDLGDGSPVCDMRPSYLRAIIMLFRLYESLFIRG